MIRRALAGILLAVMMLPACTGAKESADPSEEKTPAPTAPAMPEIAQDESAAGAEAFVRHYIDVLNYAAVTGETEELKQLAHDDCEGCRAYEKTFDEIYAADGFIRGAEWEITAVEQEQLETHVDVFVNIDIAEGTFKTTGDDSEERSGTDADLLRFSVQRADDSWNIIKFVRDES